jgi:alpha-glucosidase (family GH31 glycosyl hydrolase)
MVPIARYFVRPEEIDSTRYPWSHNEQVEQNFRRHVDLRYRLLPYFQTLGWQAYLTGVPIIRPLFMEFPNDPVTYSVDDQVMLGEDIMLAPILKKNTRTRKVYLPQGKWFDYWSGHAYEGGQPLDIQVPVDYFPLFVRGGAILPMVVPTEFIPKGHHFDRLELHFWPPFKGKLSFRDDDGTTTAYQSGKYSELAIEMTFDEKSQEIACEITKIKACAPFGPKWLGLIFHGVSELKEINVDKRIQKNFDYDLKKQELKFSITNNQHSHRISIKGTFHDSHS